MKQVFDPQCAEYSALILSAATRTALADQTISKTHGFFPLWPMHRMGLQMLIRWRGR